MHVYKEFGDTLESGKEYFVYARIVEYDSKGNAIPQDKMSQMIGIYADDGIQVNPTPFRSPYAAARLEVYNVRNKLDAVVSFRFNGKGGSFTQHMHFKLAEPRIVFYQEEYALPALYPDLEPLGFQVEGMGTKYELSCEMTGEYSGDYETGIVDALDPPKGAENVHFVTFEELTDRDGEAGYYTSYRLTVRATNGERTIENSIIVKRIHLGFNFTTRTIDCCRIPKPEAAGKEPGKMTRADFQTAVTQSRAYLVEYDTEQKVVYQVPAFPTIAAIEPLEKDNDRVKRAIDAIKLKVGYLSFNDSETTIAYYCEGGYLDPPTRYIVRITLTYEADGEKYTKTREVMLQSQPRRPDRVILQKATKEYDEKITETLYEIKENIFANYFNSLLAVYHFIERMLAGYDIVYGYDFYQVAKVMDIMTRLQNGEVVGANQEPIGYGIADDLEALAAASRGMDGVQGILMRLALAYVTGGVSELALLPMDMNRGVMDYHKATGGKGSIGGYVFWGGLPLALTVIPGAAPYVGRYMGKAGTKVARIFPKVAKYGNKAKAAAGKVKDVAVEMGHLMASDAKAAAGAVVSTTTAIGTSAANYVAKRTPTVVKYCVTKAGAGAATVGRGLKAVSSGVANEFDLAVKWIDSFDPVLISRKSATAAQSISNGIKNGQLSGNELIKKAEGMKRTLEEEILEEANKAVDREGAAYYNEIIAAKKALSAAPTDPKLIRRYNQALVDLQTSHAGLTYGNSVLAGEDIWFREQIHLDIQHKLKDRVVEKIKIKLGDHYDIDPASIVIDAATANKGFGTKFGRDFDLTPKVIDRLGGEKYFSQVTCDKYLEESTREVVEELCGKKSLSDMTAQHSQVSRLLDFTACTPQHPDFFKGGLPAVQSVVDMSKMGKGLGAEGARSISQTLRFKGLDPLEEGVKLHRKVLGSTTEVQQQQLLKELKAANSGSLEGFSRRKVSKAAQEEMRAAYLMDEAVYQPPKYDENLWKKQMVLMSEGHDIAIDAAQFRHSYIMDRCNGRAALSQTNMEYYKKWLGKDAPSLGFSHDRISIVTVQKCAELEGTTLEGFINAVGDKFETLDKIACGTPGPTASEIFTGAGIGGSIGNITGAGKKE